MKTGPLAGLSVAAISPALMSCCTQLGPASIYRDRFDYSEPSKQQALLNNVKMSCAIELATSGATGCAAGVNQFLRNESAVMSAVEHAKVAQKAGG
jgi:hypothetical protein